MKKAQALLDSLMGPSRDVTKKDKTGEDFKGDNVCQHYLVGFCPNGAFGKSVDDAIVQPCARLHSFALRDELTQHAEAAKYKRQYNKNLLATLESMVREANARGFREKQRCKDSETLIRIPDDMKKQVEENEAKIKLHVKEADAKGSAGDVTGSQEAMDAAEKCRKYVDGVKKTYSTSVKGEHTCEACGMRYLLGKEGDPIGMRSVDIWEDQHVASKLHKGWLEIREKLTEFRDVVKKEKEDREKDSKEQSGSSEKEKGRWRKENGSRERSRSRKKGAENDKRGKSKEREKDGRPRSPRRDRDAKDNKDKDKDKDRRDRDTKDRGGDRDRRERSRDRRERSRERRDRSRDRRGR